MQNALSCANNSNPDRLCIGRPLTGDRFDYNNETLTESCKRQILLNIVKMRYVDPVSFVDVGQIVTGYPPPKCHFRMVIITSIEDQKPLLYRYKKQTTSLANFLEAFERIISFL